MKKQFIFIIIIVVIGSLLNQGDSTVGPVQGLKSRPPHHLMMGLIKVHTE